MELALRDEIRNRVQSLPTLARIRLLLDISKEELSQFEQELEQVAARYEALELAAGQRAGDGSNIGDADRQPILLPQDRSPYSSEQLRRMRGEIGGRPLSKILHRLGLS